MLVSDVLLATAEPSYAELGITSVTIGGQVQAVGGACHGVGFLASDNLVLYSLLDLEMETICDLGVSMYENKCSTQSNLI